MTACELKLATAHLMGIEHAPHVLCAKHRVPLERMPAIVAQHIWASQPGQVGDHPMNERDHAELALQALQRIRKTTIEEAFALDKLASAHPHVQGTIELLRRASSDLASAVNMVSGALERD